MTTTPPDKYVTINVRVPVEDIRNGTFEKMRKWFRVRPHSMGGRAWAELKKWWERNKDNPDFKSRENRHESPEDT